jgi:hypothetical protein
MLPITCNKEGEIKTKRKIGRKNTRKRGNKKKN